MTALHLPGLEPETQRREKIRKRVRPTSVAAYADGRERFTGRKADVLRWLAAYGNRWQTWPTSAELAHLTQDGDLDPDRSALFNIGSMAHLLYVRRGLSDLQSSGAVEAVPGSKRVCAVSGRKCETWRIVPAGRTR